MCGVLLVKEGLLNVVVDCPRLSLPFSIRCRLLSTFSNVVITPCSFWEKETFRKKETFHPLFGTTGILEHTRNRMTFLSDRILFFLGMGMVLYF